LSSYCWAIMLSEPRELETLRSSIGDFVTAEDSAAPVFDRSMWAPTQHGAHQVSHDRLVSSPPLNGRYYQEISSEWALEEVATEVSIDRGVSVPDPSPQPHAPKHQDETVECAGWLIWSRVRARSQNSY